METISTYSQIVGMEIELGEREMPMVPHAMHVRFH